MKTDRTRLHIPSRKNRLIGSLLAVLAAFVFCLLPVRGDGGGEYGGEGGVVVLPGGRAPNGENGPGGNGGGQTPPRMDLRIANMTQGLSLRMPENMPQAVAFVMVGGLPMDPLATVDGQLYIPGAELDRLAAEGIEMLEYMIISPTGMMLWVRLIFMKNGELRLIVY